MGNDLVNFTSTLFAAVVAAVSLSVLRSLEIRLAFEPAVQPSDVEVEAEGGVADDLVEVAHGEVVVADVAEGGPG